MAAVHTRRVVTAGSISLALALAAPVAAFADPGAAQGPPANPGEQRSATATATIGEQGPGKAPVFTETPPAQNEDSSTGNTDSQGVGDEEQDERKVTICHATGSSTNPYVLQTISKAAVLNGHVDHQHDEDIIPAFEYQQGGQTRTFAGQGDQSILAAECAAAEDDTDDDTDGDNTGGENNGGGDGGGDGNVDDNKVTICHATGSDTNPYVVITVAKEAVINGHADHQNDEDIIPSFTYVDADGKTQTFTAQGDQSILAAECAAAEDDTDTDSDTDGDNGGGDGDGDNGGGDGNVDDNKVTICHATGSDTNPYVVITVAKEAVINGHADHQNDEDIIPSFTYVDADGKTQTFTAQGDQSILAAECAAAEDDTDSNNGGGETPVNPTTPEENPTTPGDNPTPVQVDRDEDTTNEQPTTPTTPVQGETPDQGAQSPTTPANPVVPATPAVPGSNPATPANPVAPANPVTPATPANPQAPTDISGENESPATGALPQTPTPAPAPAPAAPDTAVVAPTLGEGVVVVEQSIGGTTVEAATAGVTPVRSVVSARGAVTPATLPFTGGAELSVLLALGVGAVGLGGIANRMGTRELQAKHARR